MFILHPLAVRLGIAALIWGSALLAPAAASPLQAEIGFAAISSANSIARAQTNSSAAMRPADQISYRYGSANNGEPTPGPTDPNGPAY